MASGGQSKAHESWDVSRYYRFANACAGSGTSDGFLNAQCAAGVALAVLLIIGIAPAPCLFLLWLIYLSLCTVGDPFLSFQWDTLLLETGFLAIFFAPLQWGPKIPCEKNRRPSSRSGRCAGCCSTDVSLRWCN